MKTPVTLVLLATSLLLLTACTSATDMGSEKTNPKVSNSEMVATESIMATDFSLMDLEGNTVSLTSLQGKPVYIKFWASWCSICLAGLADIDKLSAEDTDYEIYTIVSPNFNGEQSEADFKEWFKSLSYKNIKVLLDTDGSVAKAYGIRAYPTSVVIDSKGNLVKTAPGHMENDMIQETMNKLLTKM